MKELTVELLTGGCADDSSDAGVSMVPSLEPLGGPGAPVKPAVYEGGRYQLDRRWWSPDGEIRQAVDVVVIDNVPSQANRLEAALCELRDRLGLPELVLDLSGLDLPAHLPAQLSSFLFPHRNGDAYLRDAAVDGKAFMSSEVGKALFAGSADNPAALFEWMPQALLFGFWQSHLGKKRQQTKLARSWTSEIVGYRPAFAEGGAADIVKTLGVKGDPLNLSIDDAVEYSDLDHTTWALTGEKKSGGKGDGKDRKKERLSEIGHGQVIAGGASAAVSFAEVEQRATVSFAGLRRVNAPAEGRALLAAIGLAGQVAAFGRVFSLRSGCDLRPSHTSWMWLGGGGDEPLAVPTLDRAVALVGECAAAAAAAGLPVGARWPQPLVLQPQTRLANVIAKTWPQLEEPGDGES